MTLTLNRDQDMLKLEFLFVHLRNRAGAECEEAPLRRILRVHFPPGATWQHSNEMGREKWSEGERETRKRKEAEGTQPKGKRTSERERE